MPMDMRLLICNLIITIFVGGYLTIHDDVNHFATFRLNSDVCTHDESQ